MVFGKIMQKLKLFSVLWLLPWIWPQFAHAIDFTEFGTITFASPFIQQSGNPWVHSNLGVSIGGGISLGLRIFEQIDVESGVLYLGESFSTANTSSSAGYTLWESQVPLLVRYWFSDKVSVGGGAYYSHGSGNVTVQQGSKTDYRGYADIPWNVDDLGICLSVRYRSPISELMSLVVDTRGLFGTQNRDLSGVGKLRTVTFQLWLGVAFII